MIVVELVLKVVVILHWLRRESYIHSYIISDGLIEVKSERASDAQTEGPVLLGEAAPQALLDQVVDLRAVIRVLLLLLLIAITLTVSLVAHYVVLAEEDARFEVEVVEELHGQDEALRADLEQLCRFAEDDVLRGECWVGLLIVEKDLTWGEGCQQVRQIDLVEAYTHCLESLRADLLDKVQDEEQV